MGPYQAKDQEEAETSLPAAAPAFLAGAEEPRLRLISPLSHAASAGFFAGAAAAEDEGAAADAAPPVARFC